MRAQKSGGKRACDTCRRRKVRCEGGGESTGQKCANCVLQDFECTYNATPQRREYDSRQIRRLRDRCDELEQRLSQMQQIMNSTGASSTVIDNLSTFSASATLPSMPYHEGPNKHVMHSARTGSLTPLTDNDDSDSSEDEYGNIRLLTEHVEALSLATDGGRSFHGKSSLSGVITQAAQTIPSLSHAICNRGHPMNILPQRRPIFWNVAREGFGLRASEPDRELIFPEPPLLHELVGLYFDRANAWTGLLHRPTFLHSLEKGLHRTDRGFGGVVLLVCALGAIHSDNPSHVDDPSIAAGAGIEPPWQSAGWKWASQVDPMRNALSHTPSLYDLQIYALSLVTVHAYPTAMDLCALAGIGVRRAQSVGAHRRKAYGGKLTVEGELWKRAFWALVSTERWICSALGRPCSIQEEDFDLDPPMECDDEYWSHPDPDRRFIQPEGRPSFMSFHICLLKIREIFAFASRTIYSTKKSRILSGLVGPDWEHRVVAELDSSLNHWQDLLPSHLKWDPDRADELFYSQSACLACAFYHTQMFIHRRFILSLGSRAPSPLVEASSVICLNAARSCGRIIHAFRKRSRTRTFAFSHLFMPAFEAIIILIIHVSRAIQREGAVSEQHASDLEMAAKCAGIMEDYEQRYYSAGKIRDILCHIAYSCGLSMMWPMATPLTDPPPEPMSGNIPDALAGTSSDMPLSQQDLQADDFTRWMSYEALRRDFNPFSIVNEPTDTSLFDFPFDLNNGPGIDDVAMTMPTPDFVPTSDSPFNWV